MSDEKRSKVLYIVIFTFLVFTLEIFIREPYTALSEWIQERLTFPYKCEIGDVFVWFKYEWKAVLFLFLYNVSNIYVSLSMIILDSLAIFINWTLKLIYVDPRPFWRNENLVPCTCATNYWSPSTSWLDAYLVSVVLFRWLINRYDKNWWKVFVHCLFWVPQSLEWWSRFSQNIHSLHQLTFGLAVGYIIQYVYYEIMEVDMNSVEQLKKLISSSALMLTIFLTSISWVFFNALHYYFFSGWETRKHMIHVIQRYCSTDIEYFLFDNESYQKTAMAFLFIWALAWILIEFRFVFEWNFESFAKYNMWD